MGASPVRYRRSTRALCQRQRLGVYDALHPIMSGVIAVTALFRNNVTVDPGQRCGELVRRRTVGRVMLQARSWHTAYPVRIDRRFDEIFQRVGLFASCATPVAEAAPIERDDRGVTLWGRQQDPNGTRWHTRGCMSRSAVTLFEPPRPADLTAPFVALGGETLTFELTVTATARSTLTRSASPW